MKKNNDMTVNEIRKAEFDSEEFVGSDSHRSILHVTNYRIPNRRSAAFP